MRYPCGLRILVLVVAAAILMLAVPCPGAANERALCEGSTITNADGTFEWVAWWAYGGVQPPDLGAFAERFDTGGQMCQIGLQFTGFGAFELGGPLDIYVWADQEGTPGTVLYLKTNVFVGYVPVWPTIREHFEDVTEILCVDGAYWVGYWGNWPDSTVGLYLAVDLTGEPGHAMTKVAPGQGFPEGWQPVNDVFGPTHALGISIKLADCSPVPVESMSWGKVKSLYAQ
ncbi:MAG: hypothetical protein IPK72_22785 [Candidatus Eisenbacteria bacterium]|nr:hypothetical protein [Candidatus Eisenbacteria bacterium]